jgi:hypothetical protein
MPFNGSGVFNRLYSWVNDAANGIKIRADRMDAETNGIATGLSDCVTRDGQSPALANLPMATFKHTGVGSGGAPGEYIAYGQSNAALAGLTLSAALTYGGVTLTNSVTGTQKMVLSDAPIFTNTIYISDGTHTTSIPAPLPATGLIANTDFGPAISFQPYLIKLSWAAGLGYALLMVNDDGSINVITSSNSRGGNYSFDTFNGVSSNGGLGIAFFTSGGNCFVQCKISYTGGVILVHRFGGF